MDLDSLDKKLWKELKKNAGIKSSGWFKKADASVGKHVENMVKAKKAFENTELTADLLDYQSALDKLDLAFKSFVASKGLDEVKETDLKAKEKKSLSDDIDEWQKSISKAKNDLDAKLKKLVQATKGDIKKIDALDSEKKKKVWKNIGIDDTFNL